MADGDVLVLTGGHQSFSAISELASSLPRLRGFAVNASTTYTSGTVVLSAGANITLGTNGQTITISGVAAAGAQSNQSLGLYGLSQTTGGASSTTLDARTLSINAYGAISVGFSAGSIQLSAPNTVAQSNQTQSNIAGIYDGVASISTGTIVLANANGVSFSINGQTLSGSVAAQTVQTQNVAVLSASNSVFTSGTVVLSGGNGITVGTGAQTIYISAEGLLSNWFHNTNGFSIGVTGQTNASASFVKIPIPHAVTFSRVDVLMSIATDSTASAATAAIAVSSVAVLYSANGSTLNPIVGVSGTQTMSWVSNSGIASSVTGARLASFGLATSLSAGEYVFGVHMSSASGISTGTATTALNATLRVFVVSIPGQISATAFADIPAQTASSVNAPFAWQGLVSSAITATSQTIQQSQITMFGAQLQRANLIVLFRNTT